MYKMIDEKMKALGIDDYYIIGSYARSILTKENKKPKDIDLIIPNKNDLLMKKLSKYIIYSRKNFIRIKYDKFDMLCIELDSKDNINVEVEDIVFSSTFSFEHMYYHNKKLYFNKNIFSSEKEIINELIKKECSIVNFQKTLRLFNSLYHVLGHIKKYEKRGFKINGKIRKELYIKGGY